VNWLILVLAGLFEVAFASCLAKAKGAEGGQFAFWFAGFLATLAISMLLLYRAAQTLPIGTAYAVWTGIGAIGTALFGILVLKEPATAARLVCLCLIVAGILGLKLFSPSGTST
jgi:quaternary ammonium compound-resistance protein SugE